MPSSSVDSSVSYFAITHCNFFPFSKPVKLSGAFMMQIYKIIKLHALSLLFVSSFNVLGTECKIKNKDLTYEITSSVYSYSNATKTGNCRCKIGYFH
jgi:hypothetical protein